MTLEHISAIVDRVGADLADRQSRKLDHEVPCPYWRSLNPNECACSARPVVDLLLAIAARRAA